MKRHIPTFGEYTNRNLSESLIHDDKCTSVKNYLLPIVEQLEKYVQDNIPYKGDVCEDSQKKCILEAIIDLERNINSLEDSDFEDGEEYNNEF